MFYAESLRGQERRVRDELLHVEAGDRRPCSGRPQPVSWAARWSPAGAAGVWTPAPRGPWSGVGGLRAPRAPPGAEHSVPGRIALPRVACRGGADACVEHWGRWRGRGGVLFEKAGARVYVQGPQGQSMPPHRGHPRASRLGGGGRVRRASRSIHDDAPRVAQTKKDIPYVSTAFATSWKLLQDPALPECVAPSRSSGVRRPCRWQCMQLSLQRVPAATACCDRMFMNVRVRAGCTG